MKIRQSFPAAILAYLGGIWAALTACAWLTMTHDYVATGFLAFAIAVGLSYGLLQRTRRHQVQVTRLVCALTSDDFSAYFARPDGCEDESVQRLANTLQTAVDRFRSIRSKQQLQLQLLAATIEQVPVALLELHEDGKIILLNRSARTLFRAASCGCLDDLPPALAQALREIRAGERRLVDGLEVHGPGSLALEAASIRQGATTYKIISAENIRRELESTESRAWSRVSQVLAHEMINSLTPVTSLAQTLLATLDEHEAELTAQSSGRLTPSLHENLHDLRDGLDTLARRGTGLMRFVDDYRKVAEIPVPKRTWFAVSHLLHDIETLTRAHVAQHGISLQVEVNPAHLRLWADREQLEQCLINLAKNAAEACQGRPVREVRLRAFLDDIGETLIQVTDTGPGITAQQAPNLFVPFYTTKASGSGIGLGVARQIVHAHHGQIRAFNLPTGGACFELRFGPTLE